MDGLNLITFIPENKLVARKTTKTNSRSLKRQSYVGEEVKSFYENLISQEFNDVEKSCVNQEAEDKLKRTNNGCRKSKSKSCSKSLHSKRYGRKKCSKANLETSSHCNNPQQVAVTTDLVKTLESSNDQGSKYFFDKFPTSIQRDQFKLLQYAQLGEDNKLKELLIKSNNLDVNFKDFYGWTALMCAAKEGHTCVIEILLDYGADRALINSFGDTAANIARNEGHGDSIVSLLVGRSERHCMREKNAKNRKKEDGPLFGTFKCESCQSEFSNSEKESHYTSTVHLFNNKSNMKIPLYSIPTSNRGFQMLLRSGWRADSGLGPEGQGRMYPIKTVLKQDRVGLGGDEQLKKRAKVTHFNGGDNEAVSYQKKRTKCEISVRKAAQNAAKLKKKRERRWEQNMRFEMNFDLL